MEVGNCTRVAGCPQSIRVTTANSQPVIFNPQTQSYVVDPQSQKSIEQPLDWGAIAKNVALSTLGIGAAALIGLRTLGATKNHEAAKRFIESNSSFFRDHVHKTATDMFKAGSMESYFIPFGLKDNPNDSNKTSYVVGNIASLEKFRIEEKSRDLRFEAIAKFDTSGKFTGLDVPPGFNFFTGIKWIREIFSPSKVNKGIQILTKTSDEYYTGASKCKR